MSILQGGFGCVKGITNADFEIIWYVVWHFSSLWPCPPDRSALKVSAGGPPGHSSKRSRNPPHIRPGTRLAESVGIRPAPCFAGKLTSSPGEIAGNDPEELPETLEAMR